jgi:putative flavoprotein involved in K+ transport
VTGVHDGRPLLADGRVLEPQNIVWCTGFGTDFSWIHVPVVGPDGQPRHERGVAREHPGLYFVGLFFQSTAASSLIGGVGRDARHIARHLTSRASTRRSASA